MLVSPRRVRSSINVWPGYVDALSALLMLVIFALLIFTLAQLFLSEILSNRDQELADLNARLSEISSLLGLEQERNSQLEEKVSRISEQYSLSLEKQYELMGQVDKLNAISEEDKQQIERQLLNIASLQQDIDTLQQLRQELEREVGAMALTLAGREQDIQALQGQNQSLNEQLADKELELGALRDRSKALQARLADEEERTLLAQVTIEEKEVRIEELYSLVDAGREALRRKSDSLSTPGCRSTCSIDR